MKKEILFILDVLEKFLLDEIQRNQVKGNGTLALYLDFIKQLNFFKQKMEEEL